jgi:colanic acid/amylovoran biosynthesis glycosyltransferase
VRLLGYRPRAFLLDQAYGNHLYVAPSVTARNGDTEGGAPVSIIEMAATGMPVVSTWHCDIPEIVEHGVTGLLANERDADGLVAQLDWLTQHPDAWLSMVERARRHIERHFNVSTLGKAMGEMYRQVIGPEGKASRLNASKLVAS